MKALLKKFYTYLNTVFIWRFYLRRPGPKVFVIGYLKTGTTSVGESLKLLGYKHTSFNIYVWRKLYLQGRIDDVIDYVSRFDSADDLPWLKEDMIPKLNERFPNSHWIYLTRDETAWKKSFRDWSLYHHSREVDAEKGWETYLKHERFVKDFFKSKISNKNWISLEVNDPKGFQKLADFLGKDAPRPEFPKMNVTVSK